MKALEPNDARGGSGRRSTAGRAKLESVLARSRPRRRSSDAGVTDVEADEVERLKGWDLSRSSWDDGGDDDCIVGACKTLLQVSLG